MNTTSSIKKVV